MTLSSIAHHTFPAAIRAAANGLYHLAARDASEKDYQQLISSIFRMTAATGFTLAFIKASSLEVLSPLLPALQSP